MQYEEEEEGGEIDRGLLRKKQPCISSFFRRREGELIHRNRVPQTVFPAVWIGQMRKPDRADAKRGAKQKRGKWGETTSWDVAKCGEVIQGGRPQEQDVRVMPEGKEVMERMACPPQRRGEQTGKVVIVPLVLSRSQLGNKFQWPEV